MKTKQKAIVILIPGFASSESDSTCIPFAQSFLRNFKSTAEPLKLIIIAFQYPYSEKPYTWNDIQVYPLNGKNKGKFHRIRTWLKGWKKFREIRSDFDVIGLLSFWLGECALLGKLLHKKYNIPLYTWLMGQDARKNNIYQSILNPSPEALIALSDSLSDEYSNNYNSRPAHIIPLGIDSSMLIHNEAERDIDLLAAGSLINLKNYNQFILLVSELKSNGHKIRAKVCGDGPMKDELIFLSGKLGLQNEIEFMGEIPHQSVLELMNKTKLFIHASSYEGNSAVCSEALYAGAHVISYCRPMEKISSQHHIVKDFPEMICKADELLNMPGLCHERILDYPIDESCRKILSLYSHDVITDT